MQEINFLVKADGEIQAVQIPYKLWVKIESLVRPYLEEKEDTLVQKQGPLDDFKTLMQFWDFSYPYQPDVRCPHCGAATKNWMEKQGDQFILTNANLGGLLVFHCQKCGTTIRQKHFKDHIAYEHTVPKTEEK